MSNKNFDKYQKDVIESNFPVVCIAGPGSGKTTVMIEKILNTANLDNIDKLLILTFTNNAANEIKKRLNKKLGLNRDYKYIGTFHSVFYKLLRENIQYLYKYNNFNVKKIRILEPSDDKNFFEYLVKTEGNYLKKQEKETNKKYNDRLKNEYGINLSEIFSIYSNIFIKVNLKDINQVRYFIESNHKFKEIFEMNEEVGNEIVKLLLKYQEEKKKKGLLNFTDILLYTNFLLNKFENFKQKIKNKFEYVFVDELQDTNKLQINIIEKIIKDNYFMIGDPYQSIYRFLGADIKGFIKYIKKQDRTSYKQLVYNYRSKNNLVEFINKFMQNFEDKNDLLEEKYKSYTTENGNIIIKEYEDIEEYIISYLLNVPKENHKNIAILARNNYEFMNLELKLSENSIPFTKLSGPKITDLKEIKYINNIIRLWLSNDFISFFNLLDTLEGIGEKTKNIIIKEAEDLLKIINFLDKNNMKNMETFVDNLKISKKAKTVLKNFLVKFYKDINYQNLEEILELNNDENYIHYLIDKRSEKKQEEIKKMVDGYIKNLKEIFDNKKGKNDIIEYIDKLSLSDNRNKEQNNCVTLSTIHSAKGLEWEEIILMNLDDENLPYETKIRTKEDREEEKRLIYVGISRAKEKLTLLSRKNISELINKILF